MTSVKLCEGMLLFAARATKLADKVLIGSKCVLHNTGFVLRAPLDLIIDTAD